VRGDRILSLCDLGFRFLQKYPGQKKPDFSEFFLPGGGQGVSGVF
jgi:hypothetical protein